jgi:hypothetical protein
LLKHLPDFVFHTEPHATQINSHDMIKVLFRALIRSGHLAQHAGAIHGAINSSENLYALLDHAAYLACIGHIARHEQRLAASLANDFNRVVTRVCLDVDNGYFRTLSRKRNCRSPPNARGSSCYDRSPILKRRRHGFLSSIEKLSIVMSVAI